MPGIVVFKRRWGVGSDDLIIPALLLLLLHIAWIVVLTVVLAVVEFDGVNTCTSYFRYHAIGYVAILGCCAVVEAVVSWVSMRGTILNPEPRSSMQYLLYVRLVLLFLELAWLILGVVWMAQHYQACMAVVAKKALLGVVVCNWAVMLIVFISISCTFDTAGRSWVKMKSYQDVVREREARTPHRRQSGSRRRNWRQRKVIRAYEKSWDRRCKLLFCCVNEDGNKNSFNEVAQLFTEFFRDLDVVPSDIVAGLVLLRRSQKRRRAAIVAQEDNDVVEFLSGVPITPRTQFLDLNADSEELVMFNKVVHFMCYALAAYGWPMYMMMNAGTGLCKIMPYLNCCCCCKGCCGKQTNRSSTLNDNCCDCNIAALRKLTSVKDMDLVYATYHVGVGETPFFIAVDHEEQKVVISVRGTLSLHDVLTDLNADCELLPVDPPKEDWMGHKGMVQAAAYIKRKIKDELLLSGAFGLDVSRGTEHYDLVIVGHSLGAGTAAILAILMYQEFPSLHCYAFSPPGGLLSATCREETKSFITSVVVGKDVVPRIGLAQLEALRQDLINQIKHSKVPKWKTIGTGLACCGGGGDDSVEMTDSQIEMHALMKEQKEKQHFVHPRDSEIALTSHTPLFLPGRIIHVARNHPEGSDRPCSRIKPIYKAFWADCDDFDEVIISPTMANDHMPDNVMEALQKVLLHAKNSKSGTAHGDDTIRV